MSGASPFPLELVVCRERDSSRIVKQKTLQLQLLQMTTTADTLAVPKQPEDLTSSQVSYTSVDMEKKKDLGDTEDEDRGAVSGKTAEDDDDDEYPKGAKLGVIVLALCLCIFLMSLDFVRGCP